MNFNAFIAQLTFKQADISFAIVVGLSLIFIFIFLFGYFLKVKRTASPNATPQIKGVSVIIACRNDKKHIEKNLPQWLAQDYPWQAAEHANRIMDFRDKFGEDRVIDVHYGDLMRKPIETMRTLYKALGDDFTPQAQASMQAR